MGVYKDMWGYGVLNVWGSVLRFSAERCWLGLRVSGLMAWGSGCLGPVVYGWEPRPPS